MGLEIAIVAGVATKDDEAGADEDEIAAVVWGSISIFVLVPSGFPPSVLFVDLRSLRLQFKSWMKGKQAQGPRCVASFGHKGDVISMRNFASRQMFGQLGSDEIQPS